jgi:hypothetical protein
MDKRASRWSDNGVKIDDSFPLMVKLCFAAETPGIYTINDISLVVRRGFEPSKRYSLLTEAVPRRLAFYGDSDVRWWSKVDYIETANANGAKSMVKNIEMKRRGLGELTNPFGSHHSGKVLLKPGLQVAPKPQSVPSSNSK